jgi:predicted aspartyl protease
MQLTLRDNLPFTSVTVAYRGMKIDIPDVLVDTGSATTILAADTVAAIQIVPSPKDALHTIRGVGGSEVAFVRQVDYLQVGEYTLSDFEVEIGGMDYGFEIKGILGMDFLTHSGAIINLRELKIEFTD